MMSVAFEDAITRGVLDVARQRGRQASRPFRTGGVVALSSRWKENVDSPSLEATAASRCPRMRSCLDAFSENVGAPSLGARVLRRSYPSRSGRRTGASSSTSPTTTSIPRRSNHLSGRVTCRAGHVPAITQRQEDATLKSGSRLMRNPRWRRSGRQRNRFAVATPPTPHHARLPSAQVGGAPTIRRPAPCRPQWSGSPTRPSCCARHHREGPPRRGHARPCTYRRRAPDRPCESRS